MLSLFERLQEFSRKDDLAVYPVVVLAFCEKLTVDIDADAFGRFLRSRRCKIYELDNSIKYDAILAVVRRDEQLITNLTVGRESDVFSELRLILRGDTDNHTGLRSRNVRACTDGHKGAVAQIDVASAVASCIR